MGLEPLNTSIYKYFHPQLPPSSIDGLPGWFQLINMCHAELVALDPEYVIMQIKDKFGGMRYYISSEMVLDDELGGIYSVIGKYEALSFTTDIKTGERISVDWGDE